MSGLAPTHDVAKNTDSWESTPNSAGWYHTLNQYAANGTISARYGYLGTGTSAPFSNGLEYAMDAEGRVNGLWDQSLSQWLWEGTTYSPASQPNQLQFYSGDSESFGWDANTGRMTSWTSTVGSLQQAGSLTWNANGTLQTMQINDSANTGNTQTCNYVYDDLTRLSSAGCGSPWAQTFSYDAFGNITKAGSSIFNPGYASNNRITGFSYDPRGDITNDGTNAYTYNAQGRAITAGGSTISYDAFNREVELQTTNGYTQFVYAPDGFKFCLYAWPVGCQIHCAVDGGVAGGIHSGPARASGFLETFRLAGDGSPG